MARGHSRSGSSLPLICVRDNVAGNSSLDLWLTDLCYPWNACWFLDYTIAPSVVSVASLVKLAQSNLTGRRKQKRSAKFRVARNRPGQDINWSSNSKRPKTIFCRAIILGSQTKYFNVQFFCVCVFL